MDLQFWITVIVVAITILTRAMKKKPAGDSRPQKRPASARDEDERTAEDRPLPQSFEELLREIQGSKAPKAPLPVPAPVKPYESMPYGREVDYDDDIKEEEIAYEAPKKYIPEEKSNTYDIYEKARQDAFGRASLEETMKLADTVMRYDKFKGYQKPEPKGVLAEYLSELKDPQGFKKAFVLSEILGRRF